MNMVSERSSAIRRLAKNEEQASVRPFDNVRKAVIAIIFVNEKILDICKRTHFMFSNLIGFSL